MHIPDGYLGPIMWVSMFAVMIPLWLYATRKLKKELKTRQVPVLAMGAAFTFVVMMFNFPIVGGSTGHAVGGTLIAIILGPWASLVAVSVALAIQALFFGDGGITAYATNCFNMAFVLPFVGYLVYRLISLDAKKNSARVWVGAGIGGWVGICVAASFAGFELGLQTILYPAVNGQFQYFMYPLSVSVPAMALQHMAVYGIVEAVVTLLVARYLQHSDSSLLKIPSKAVSYTVEKVVNGVGA